MADVAFYFGTGIGVFLLSRFGYAITKRWPVTHMKIAIVYFCILVFTTLVGGYGLANGGPYAPLLAFQLYAPATLIWFAWDYWAHGQE